jgi:sulfate adenylyltransferase subunit 2
MKGEHPHLDSLEDHSVFILREANHAFKNMAMPWSMGKDSNVLLWLTLKAFFGKVPFPLLHIDTPEVAYKIIRQRIATIRQRRHD